MSIAASMAGARLLWSNSARLGLNPIDRIKYALGWYLSRRAVLSAVAPAHFVLQVRNVRVPMRPNGIDLRTTADIFGFGMYECQLDRVTRILDLGANIGLATLFFAKRFPQAKVASVEPFPGNQQVLRETIRLNDVPATIFEGAVGVNSGQAELHVGCGADSFSLVPAETSGPTIKVRQFTVPELMESMGWDEIDLLKVDIEGYEKTLFEVNQDWLSRVRLIVGEAHGHVGYGMAGLRADLEPFGFEVIEKGLMEHGLTIFEARNVRRGA